MDPVPWPDDEFVEFARARQHTLLRAAYLVCGDLRLAEDLLSEALVRLARHWEQVREERPDLFVRRVLYRDAVASWRKRTPDPGADPGPAASEWADADDAWDADVAERRRAVLRALDTLTPRQRAVVVLTRFEERGEPEAAEVLGCGAGTVRALAEEALARLRTSLPPAGLGAGGAR